MTVNNWWNESSAPNQIHGFCQEPRSFRQAAVSVLATGERKDDVGLRDGVQQGSVYQLQITIIHNQSSRWGYSAGHYPTIHLQSFHEHIS